MGASTMRNTPLLALSFIMGIVVLAIALPTTDDIVPEQVLTENVVVSPKASNLYETDKDGAAFENIFLGGQKASSESILKTLSSLRAYCVLAHDKAADVATKGSSGVIPFFVVKFATEHFAQRYKPPLPKSGDADVDFAAKMANEEEKTKNRHENVVIEYSRAMGETRKVPEYASGINKYILDRVDETLMAGTDIVQQYVDKDTGASKIRLNIKALGLTSVPGMFDGLSVAPNAYYENQGKVLTDANRMINAAKIWIKNEEGKVTSYNSFTRAPTAHPTATPTKTPTSTPTATPTKAPTRHPTKAPTKHPTGTPTRAPCTVEFWNSGGGHLTTVTATTPKTVRFGRWLEDSVSSYRQSASCGYVEYMDEDHCTAGYSDNMGKAGAQQGTLPYDLREDLCGIKIHSVHRL